jgi:hypothetical protein
MRSAPHVRRIALLPPHARVREGPAGNVSEPQPLAVGVEGASGSPAAPYSGSPARKYFE